MELSQNKHRDVFRQTEWKGNKKPRSEINGNDDVLNDAGYQKNSEKFSIGKCLSGRVGES